MMLQSELKQAKQQSQDLHRTSEFFGALLTGQPEEKVAKPTSERSTEEPQTNGHPVPPRMDPMSPFSQPPAPPPQQPLPEKPDASHSNNHNAFTQPSLKRTVTEKPILGLSSPDKTESSSQILSLVEALTSAKREIDSQGDRVKQLEDLLRQERKARESAEERARRLENPQPTHVDGDGTSGKRSIWDDSDEHLKQWRSDRSSNPDPVAPIDGSPTSSEAAPSQPPSQIQTPEDIHKQTAAVDASTSHLQQRLDLMLAEMDEMKAHMERYKRRAELAEVESVSARKTLAQMVESIRAADPNTTDKNIRPHLPDGAVVDADTNADLTANTHLVNDLTAAIIRSSGLPNGTPGKGTDAESQQQQLLQAVATALATRDQQAVSADERLYKGAPFASMFGVVLIGVGIMTWLNGWGKVER